MAGIPLHPEGQAWCSGHRTLHDKTAFSCTASGEPAHRYCREYRAGYMRRWRREGRPAKQLAAYRATLQAEAADGLASLAEKYANR